eukprot:gene7574-11599_t
MPPFCPAPAASGGGGSRPRTPLATLAGPSLSPSQVNGSNPSPAFALLGSGADPAPGATRVVVSRDVSKMRKANLDEHAEPHAVLLAAPHDAD